MVVMRFLLPRLPITQFGSLLILRLVLIPNGCIKARPYFFGQTPDDSSANARRFFGGG
jgi:hypothetical protein